MKYSISDNVLKLESKSKKVLCKNFNKKGQPCNGVLCDMTDDIYLVTNNVTAYDRSGDMIIRCSRCKSFTTIDMKGKKLLNV